MKQHKKYQKCDVIVTGRNQESNGKVWPKYEYMKSTRKVTGKKREITRKVPGKLGEPINKLLGKYEESTVIMLVKYVCNTPVTTL